MYYQTRSLPGIKRFCTVCGSSEKILVLEVDAAIVKMKQAKSGGPTGVVLQMLKAAGETGIHCEGLMSVMLR